MNLTLNVWRQKDARDPGQFVTYQARDISPEMSFLEMLDVVNERLIASVNDTVVMTVDDLQQGSVERGRLAPTGQRVGVQAWSSSDLVIETLRIADR